MGAAAVDDQTVGQLGERRTLARILPLLPLSETTRVPPGDDAAVSALSSPEVVTTCDMMVEGPDFRFDWSTPHDVGWKAMASNLADVAAMGATPVGVIVAVAAPPDTKISVLEGISRGIADGLAVMAPGCGVLGGDLSAAPVLILSVTVLGDLHGRQPVLRSGASVGDVVCVAGELGSSERGYRILMENTTRRQGHLEASLRDTLREEHPDVAHHLAPTPPIALGPVAADSGATAMMDISDGLVLDLTRMVEASGVSAELHPSLADNEPALMGGEDHGLLATFPPQHRPPEGFVEVGTIVQKDSRGPVLIDGQPPQVSRPGWDPYRDSSRVNTRVSP